MKSKMMVWGGAAIVGLSLILSACGGGTATTDPVKTDPVKTDPTLTTASVAINGFAYVAKNTSVKVGTEVTIAAESGHPLIGIDEGNSNLIPATVSTSPVKVTFTKAGTYKFKCQFHNTSNDMNGTIIVTN